MRVEDLGLGCAGAGGDRVAVALDRGAGGGDRVVEQRALTRRVVGARAGGGAASRPRRDRAGRTDREPGRGGDAGEHVAGAGAVIAGVACSDWLATGAGR